MDVEDLIDRHCVMAGMIMEDASVGAISTGPSQHERVPERVRVSEIISSVARTADLIAVNLAKAD